jgi:translation initiation factor IF-3
MAGPNRNFSRQRRDDKPKFWINEQIRAREIRLVGDNVEEGVYSKEEALEIAKAQELDLVEIFPNGNPPVCKVIDYGKFLYEQKKKQKELKAKSAKTVLKEVRFTPNTDDHDFNFKLNHAINFLKDGAKVKAFVHFKGRAIVHKERGELLLLRFAKELESYGKIEKLPKLEGKRMTIFINPKGSKN